MATPTPRLPEPDRPEGGPGLPPTRALATALAFALALVTPALVPAPVSAGPAPENPAASTPQGRVLSLAQALELAAQRHPRLAEARARVEAADGRLRQAGALPLPELVLGAQQLPLDQNASNQREYVAGIAQSVPMGRRTARARAAEELEREARQRGLEAVQRELRRQVHGAFATALYQEQAYQAQLRLTRDARRLLEVARARAAAGDSPAAETARAGLELARAELELRRTQALRDEAKTALAAAIGDARFEIASVEGSLDATLELPTLESLAASLASHPELLEADATLRAVQARIALARSERIPDLRVEALYHRLEGPGENTVDIGLGIPLPSFTRHEGRMREARAEAAAAAARRNQLANELQGRLRLAFARLNTALAAVATLKTDILPRAEIVLKSAEARHAAGDLGLAEMLPMRRDWAALELTRLEALREVMQAWIDVSTGTSAP